MRARKVQINASNGSQPERFKTAREAQEAADKCNIPGEINPVIVGCCGPRFYVLLIDDGDTVKYYSALNTAWILVSVKAAEIETVELEVQGVGTEKQSPAIERLQAKDIEAIGAKAYKDGKKCFPSHDSSLDNLPKEVSKAKAYKHWVNGWTLAWTKAHSPSKPI